MTSMYTVNIYQGPISIVEDILHLEIVMGLVDTSFLNKKKRFKKKLTGYLKKYSFMDSLPKIPQVNSQSYDS